MPAGAERAPVGSGGLARGLGQGPPGHKGRKECVHFHRPNHCLHLVTKINDFDRFYKGFNKERGEEADMQP